jgi:hypothetical protein
MKRTLLITIMLLCAAIATAQNDRDGFTRCHLLLDQLFLGGTQLTGTSWSCAADSVACVELLSAGNLVTGSELSAGDIVSMTPGAGVWHTFEVTAVGTDSSFTRSTTTCSGTGTHDYVLEGISGSALWRHGDGITATSLQLYDSVGNAGAAGISTTELWATELRVGGSAGAVCLEDDSGELDVTDCAGGAGDLSAGTITADSILSSSGTYLAVDTALDAASGHEISAHIEYQVDKAAGNDTGLRITKTDVISPGTSYLLEGYVASSQQFGFTDAGGLVLGGLTVGPYNDGVLDWWMFGAAGAENAVVNRLMIGGTSGPYIADVSGTFDFLTNAGAAASIRVGGTVNMRAADATITTSANNYNLILGARNNTTAQDMVQLSTGTSSNTTGHTNAAGVFHIWNQPSGDASNTDFVIYRTDTAVGSGDQLFLDMALDGGTIYSFATDGTLLMTGSGALTMTGDATVWDDMPIPVEQVFVPGAKAPSWESFSAGYLLGFEYQAVAGNEEEVSFTRQIPHNYLEGSDIIPHVHWSPETDDSATARWCLEYEWRNIGGTYSSTTTVCADQAIDTEASDHIVTGLSSGIDGTGMTISSELICRLYRNSSHANDNFDDKALLIEVDFHYQIDSLGSRTEYTK